jgi:hypothetical protein
MNLLSRAGVGRGCPPHDRTTLASAYVANAVLGLTTTSGLIEQLTVDRALKRICGFSMWKKLPGEATFSRKLPRDIQQVALRKLFMLDKAQVLKEALQKVRHIEAELL